MNKDDRDPKLSSHDAMMIATRWAPTLQRCVRLDDDLTSQLYGDRTNYEWINVSIDRERSAAARDELALAARATVRVWQLLTTCRGFGVRQNPRFWRSVLLAFWQTTAQPSYGPASWAPQHDATLFQSVAFPRVQLCVAGGGDEIDRAVGLFCGVETTRSEISSELDDAIASLLPFVAPRQCAMESSPIELRVCFDLKQTSTERINALVERVHDAQQHTAAFPVRIQSLYPADYWSRFESDWEYASTLRVPLSERTLALDTDWATSRDSGVPITKVLGFREALRWSLQLAVGAQHRETSAGVQHLTFMKGFDDEGMPALCSALPHTQCLESLTVDASDAWASYIQRNDIRWLGYALFHPDTSASSTWRRLHFSGLELEHDGDATTPSVLHMMARGNNLLANWDTPPSELVDFYFTATIRAGAGIRLGLHHTDRVETSMRMDVCGVRSTNLEELPEMVNVVVPGFGLGLVERGDVVSIDARAPGRPRLSAVSIGGSSLSRDDVATILQHSASTLQYVDLELHDDLVRWRPSRAAVLALLSVVAHDGRRDADEENTDDVRAVTRLDRDLVTLIARFGDQEVCVSS